MRDKIVLIGSSAPEAGAFLPVAGAPLAPTVQIQAEAIEQILAGRFLMRPANAIWWETRRDGARSGSLAVGARDPVLAGLGGGRRRLR